MTVAIYLAIIAAIILLCSGIQDVLYFRISNLFPAAIFVTFFLYAFVAEPAVDWVSHLTHFGIALMGGMALFALRWFGGGDAKLYAAISIWFGLDQAVTLLFCVTFAGLLVAIGYIVGRRIMAARGRPMKSSRERRIPYGIAIAIGGIGALVQTGQLPL